MNTKRVIIKIQQLNCLNCTIKLKKKLTEIKNISHINIRYDSSEVVFNYQIINDVSNVENMLTFLGFPPLGEKINFNIKKEGFCINTSDNLFSI